MAQTNLYSFWKMNGLGNEILVVDIHGRSAPFSERDVADITETTDLGFDQLMALHDARQPGTDTRVLIYNRDGTIAGACGNGMRCVALLVSEATGNRDLAFETSAGILTARVDTGDRISIDMGTPKFDWDQIPLAEKFHNTRWIELQAGPIDNPVLHSPSVVNVGNPHAVFWIEDDPEHVDLARFGPLLENHPIFPEGANISIAQPVGRDRIKLRTWERGAGLTQACGSAACAATVCGARTRRTDRDVTVMLPGGALAISWTDADRIIMTGPAMHEFSGQIEIGAPVTRATAG